MTNKERKERIEQLRKEIKTLIETCPHEVINSSSQARCYMCDAYFGWYCEESPTHVCDYVQEDGECDEDSCIYCGEPEERK